MRSTVALSLLLTRLATATFYNGGKSGSGDFYPGAYSQAGSDIPDISPLQNGAANPNASNSVDFNGFTWRTNVSEVFVNDATTANGTAVLNARVISTVFDLRWQGNGSIGVALQSQGVVAPFGCIMMMDGLALPENVTSRYSEADNGTCTNVLGDDCVRDFLASISTPDGSSCPETPSASEMPASCAGTLGTAKTGFNGLTENLEQLQGGSNATALQSGQAFAHILSSAYNGSNATAALQEAESRLQILVIKGLNAMACQKVNSTLTVASEPMPAGVTPSSTKTNAASVMERNLYGVLGLGMFGAIFLGL